LYASLALIGEWFILLLDVCDAFVTQSNSAKKRRTGNTANFNEIRGLYCYFIYDHSFSHVHFPETVVHLMFGKAHLPIFFIVEICFSYLFLLLNILPTIFYQ
jgi:hypothetical protein